jgi:hypothetical protein
LFSTCYSDKTIFCLALIHLNGVVIVRQDLFANMRKSITLLFYLAVESNFLSVIVKKIIIIIGTIISINPGKCNVVSTFVCFGTRFPRFV